MGQARIKRAQFRSDLISELERLMVPETPDEKILNDEIRTLTFYHVARAPAKMIAWMKMEPQACHANAAAYAKLDPDGSSRSMSGWWQKGEIYYFHSVVFRDGTMTCITPHPDNRELAFAPDFEIIWHEVDGAMKASRKGRQVPLLVRAFPQKVIAGASAARAALLSGANPDSIDYRW